MRPARFIFGTVVATSVLSGCDYLQDAPTTARVPDMRPYVSEQLAFELTAKGQFRLAAPKAPDDIPIISPERARELAAAFLRTWGSTYLGMWGWERGGTLSEGSVVPAERVYFARTAHGRIPDDLYHPAIRRIYGPMYLVPLLSGSETVAILAVSAYSTDLQIDNRGLVRTPPLGGSYFFPHSVAPSPPDPRFRYVAVGPEEAVKSMSEQTGARVTQVPDLVLMPSFHPASARWRLTLDRPVRVHRVADPAKGRAAQAIDRTPFSVRELYLGEDYVLTVAAAQQPAHARITYPTGPAQPRGREPTATAEVPHRPDVPVIHSRVEFDKETRR